MVKSKLRGLIAKAYVYVIVSFAYISVSIWNWRLPGIQLDEVGFFSYIPGFFSKPAAALNGFRIPDNYIDLLDGSQQYPIFGYDIYFTQIPIYIFSPIIEILNYSFASLRITESVMGLACLFSVVKLVTRSTSSFVALMCSLLVISNPVFVVASRSQGWMFLNILTLSLLAINIILSSRIISKKYWDFVYPLLAGFFLATLSHIYFVGFFVAVPIFIWGVALLIEKKRSLIAMLLGTLGGLLPLFYAVISLWLLQPSRLLNPFNPVAIEAQASFETLSFQNINRMSELIQGSLVSFSFAQGVSGPFTYFGSAALGLILLCGSFYSFIRYWSLRKAMSYELKRTIEVILFSIALSLIGAFVLHLINFHHLIVPMVLFYIVFVLMLNQSIGRTRVFATLTSLIVVIQCGALQSFQTALVNSQGMGYHNVAWMAPGAGKKFCSENETYYFVGWGAHLQYLFLTGGKNDFVFEWQQTDEDIKRIKLSATRPTALIESTWNSQEPDGQMKFADGLGNPLYAVTCIYPK